MSMTDDVTDTDDPQAEPGDSRPWLAMIESAEKAFASYQSTADRIDKLYADLDQMKSATRDREFALFWSNIQVIGPSIYARPPVPVVTPKFKDRRPIYRVSSELLERCSIVAFDMAGIDETMLLLRDDLAITARGSPWVRYETEGESETEAERVVIEHIDRKDFLHEPARKWCEVGWVARRAWLTREEMRKRFRGTSGDAYQTADYAVQSEARDRGAADHREKCGVWEIWSKTEDKVVWVAPGCDVVLDEGEPHLKLEGFFPCPKPAYGTLQRRSLIPVPDMVYYKDQLEEINDLTRRIHALSWAIKVRGFYAGGGDLGDAIERAIRDVDDERLLIPVPALQALMQGGGDPIVWMPLEMIAATIQGLIELRRQIIDDVYQIMGLSDIMRGSTEAQETLGAQQLKQQNGSVRVRDKQNELIRVARDLVRIAAEIMAEEFDRDTLIDMAQMEIPTEADINRQIKALEKQAREQFEAQMDQVEQGQADPQAVEQMQQQVVAQIAPQIQKLGETPTVEAVMEFLKDQKLRPFVLDIETDSTVMPDEMAEKASRAELMGVFGQSITSLMPLLQAGDQGAALAGEMLKFALGPYRVGRQLEGVIDDFIDAAPQIAEQMRQQDEGSENEELAAAQMRLAEAEVMKAQAQTAKVEADAMGKQQDMQLRATEAQARAQADQQRLALELEDTKGKLAETEARITKIYAEVEAMGLKAELDRRTADREDVKTVADITSRQQQEQRAAAESARSAQMGERQQTLAERQAIKPEGD